MIAYSGSDQVVVLVDKRVLRAAVAAYLGRYRGESRIHTGSDLKVFLTWRSGQELDPLNVGRAEIERYVRWLQEVRRYQPSTVSRRLSVVVGFYRACVIDQILPFSPAEYVRRPPMPTDLPTLGLGHLQFEALLTTARPQNEVGARSGGRRQAAGGRRQAAGDESLGYQSPNLTALFCRDPRARSQR